MRKTESVSEKAFLIDENEGVALLSCCSCFGYSPNNMDSENGSNESEVVEVMLGDTTIHSNVNDMTEIVRKIDNKLSIIEDKIDRVNNRVDLLDE